MTKAKFILAIILNLIIWIAAFVLSIQIMFPIKEYIVEDKSVFGEIDVIILIFIFIGILISASAALLMGMCTKKLIASPKESMTRIQMIIFLLFNVIRLIILIASLMALGTFATLFLH